MDTLITEKLKNNMSDELFAPRGYVIIQDNKTKKILYEGHNLITKPGREAIWDTFRMLLGEVSNPLTGYSINEVAISDYTYLVPIGEVLKTEEYTIPTTGNDANKWLLLSTVSAGGEPPVTVETGELNGHYYKLFKTNILGSSTEAGAYIGRFNSAIVEEDNDANTTIRISTLGLVLNDGTNKKLFSRINFDPIFFAEDTDLNIQYFIYF